MAQRARRGQDNGEPTWQQTKSAATRKTILDAALDDFYEVGYGQTTTEQIARRANVSRGAMLHHFPTRFHLIRGAVEHLNARRLAEFERAEIRVQKNVTHTQIEQGIEAYWKTLSSRWFVIFHELQVASRTDVELRRILVPAIRNFDERWLELSSRVFPDLSHSRNFMLGNFITVFLLEGMAINQQTRKPGKWLGIVREDLKQRLVNELFKDVVGIERGAVTPRTRKRSTRTKRITAGAVDELTNKAAKLNGT